MEQFYGLAAPPFLVCPGRNIDLLPVFPGRLLYFDCCSDSDSAVGLRLWLGGMNKAEYEIKTILTRRAMCSLRFRL